MTHEKDVTFDNLARAYAGGLERLARSYPGSGIKTKLRVVRTALGFTQQQMADELGVTLATLKNWELPRKGEPDAAARTLISMFYADPEKALALNRGARADADDSVNVGQAKSGCTDGDGRLNTREKVLDMEN